MIRILPFYTTESQLVKALQLGDSKAQKVVFERYSGKMLALCCRYISRRSEAEEVMIDGFMRVYEKVHQFKEEGSFEGWVKRIMITESLTYLRRIKSIRQEVSLEELSSEPDYLWVEDTLEPEEILNLVNQLPDGYRTIFNLYAIEGYSHKEIADMLEITESTSKSQLHRARALLQAGLTAIEQQKKTKTSYEKASHR